MTQLRKQMLDELQRRNYSQTTVKGYLKIVEAFAKHFHRSPDQLGPEQIRAYQVYLFTERKLNARTVGHHTAALRFFFCKTLKRAYPIEEVPYPKAPRRLPTILTQDSAHKNKKRLMSLPVEEFLRRFLLHVLPRGFVRIRHFGLFAHRRRAALLPLCFQLLASAGVPAHASGPEPKCDSVPPLWLCPKCGDPMLLLERLSPVKARLRSPPLKSKACP